MLRARVTEILELNLTNHFVALILESDRVQAYPVYFAQIVGESTIRIPVTDATGIADALKSPVPASTIVADPAGGFEAYELRGVARHISEEEDYEAVAAARSLTPGFPVHGAVIFEIDSVHPVPPP